MANAAESIIEAHAYRTDVLPAEDGSEQRVRLRTHPLGSAEFSLLCEDREAAAMNALVWGQQAQSWAIPLWQHARRLLVTAEPAATSVEVETDSAPFQDWQGIGAYALAWRGPFDWELLSLASVGAGVLNLSAPVIGTWPALETLIVPVREARSQPTVELQWPSSRVLTARVAFTFDNTDDTGASVPGTPPTFTQYQGFDLLEIMPARNDPAKDGYSRPFRLFEANPGKRSSLCYALAPSIGREFHWICFARSEAADLRAFLDSRFGRWKPFWMPSWERDLRLAQPATPSDYEIVIESCGYSAQMFPTLGARRHLQFVGPDHSTFRRGVLNAVDNEDGTETLTLDGTLGVDVTPAWMICFLRFSRLADDEVKFEWRSADVMQSRVGMVELALEAPIPVVIP
jgi:hypothetical protein